MYEERICYFSQANKVNWLNYVKTHYVRLILSFFYFFVNSFDISYYSIWKESTRIDDFLSVVLFTSNVIYLLLKRLPCTFGKAIDIHYVVLLTFYLILSTM